MKPFTNIAHRIINPLPNYSGTFKNQFQNNKINIEDKYSRKITQAIPGYRGYLGVKK